MIEILLFARLREAVGQESIQLEWESEGTVEQLFGQLERRYPAVGFEHVVVAVNEQYAEPGDTVRPGSIVALIPPVSGG